MDLDALLKAGPALHGGAGDAERARFDAAAPFEKQTLFLAYSADYRAECAAELPVRLELAASYKRDGNAAFKEGSFAEALHQFVRGLGLFAGIRWRPGTFDGAGDDATRKLQAVIRDEDLVFVTPEEALAASAGAACSSDQFADVLCALYGNTAACLLRTEAWAACIAACDRALAVRPGNPKSLYRRAKARLAAPGATPPDGEAAVSDLVTALGSLGVGADAVPNEKATDPTMAAELRALLRRARDVASGVAPAAEASPPPAGASPPPPMSEADVIRNPPPELKSAALSMGVELDDPRVQKELARLVALKRREEKHAKTAARSRRAAERAGGSKGSGSDAQLPAGLSYVDGAGGDDGSGSDADDEDEHAGHDDDDGLDLVDVDVVGGTVRQAPPAGAAPASSPVPRSTAPRSKPRAKPRAASTSASDNDSDDDDEEEEETVDLSHVAAGPAALRRRKPDVYSTSSTGSVARVVAGAAVVAAAAKPDAAASANLDDVDDDGRPFDTMETLQAMIAGVDKMSTDELKEVLQLLHKGDMSAVAAGAASSSDGAATTAKSGTDATDAAPAAPDAAQAQAAAEALRAQVRVALQGMVEAEKDLRKQLRTPRLVAIGLVVSLVISIIIFFAVRAIAGARERGSRKSFLPPLDP